MFDPNALSWKHRKPRPRKKCLDKLIMALYLRLNIRLHGIWHLTRHHGDKHLGISIKPLGLMLLSINSDLYQSITVASTRTNPSSLKGLRKWKKSNTTVSLLSGCRAWWSGWCSPASNHPLEGRLGSRRTATPWGGTDAPSRFRCSCLGFGS
jgi:hypothetical protein